MKFTAKNGFVTNIERSNLMKKIRSFNTKPELILRRLMWSRGLRFRVNYSSLPGKPDIVFTKYKLVIFVDGEFWHGYNWESKRLKIKSNAGFWIPKIEKNMQRDKNNSEDLGRMGYEVLRFWSNDILKNPHFYVEFIMEKIKLKNSKH